MGIEAYGVDLMVDLILKHCLWYSNYLLRCPDAERLLSITPSHTQLIYELLVLQVSIGVEMI